MLKINAQKLELLTVKGFFKENAQNIKSPFLNQGSIGDITYSDAFNCVYIYLGEKSRCDYSIVYDSLRHYLRKVGYSFNIELDSFLYDESENALKAALEGAMFGEYNQYSLKTKIAPRNVTYNLVSKKDLTAMFKRGTHLIESINLCRDLNDEPPNICTPMNFYQEANSKLKECENLKIKVLSRKECEKLGMGIFLAVGQGSPHESCIMVVEYNGNPQSQEKTAFVGKGITMDTGGYALKPWIGQRNERMDMCGAGAVISAMYGIAKEKPKANIVALGAMSENLIGENTVLNTSIVTAMNGLSVELNSMDAEGRLVMSDAITYAIQKLHATKIITVATLTGSAISALGKTASAGMATCDQFFTEIASAAKKGNEELWRLPISRENYRQMSVSEYADLNNASWEKYCTAGTAAAFLDFFTEGLPFVHIDIAGSAYINDRSHGTMVKTLIEYACQ